MNICPGLRIVDISGGSGLSYETGRQIEQVVDRLDDLVAVYSMGGGNRAILRTLSLNSLVPKLYIAHDLDHENMSMLQGGKLSFVLHH